MILDQIIEQTRKRVDAAKDKESMELVKEHAKQKATCEAEHISFIEQFKGPGIHFICEVKKASPSKGIIAEEFPYLKIARDYEKAGASAVSVLTEPFFFKGNDNYLKEIKKEISIPVLRKDFIIDAYQIYEAKTLGADCILLICAVLSQEQLQSYLQLAHKLNMDALVEVHDEKEMDCALGVGANLIGVNNRNLKDFSVDIKRSLQLRKRVPDTITFIAESGIQTKEQIKSLYDAGVNGVLIGETLMRCEGKKEKMKELVSLLPTNEEKAK